MKLETLKFIASVSIVLTAVCIMLPGVMGYAFSLARLGLVILIAIVVSSGLAFLYHSLIKKKKDESPSNISAASEAVKSNSETQA